MSDRKKGNENFWLGFGLAALGMGIWTYVRRRVAYNRPAEERVHEERKLALITGASSGIGSVFARELAARGYDLVLLARREERLRALAEELQQQGVSAGVLVADLSDAADVERVEKVIGELPHLDLLINNAGFGVAGDFITADYERLQAMIAVHVTASMRLTHAALPGMVARGHGAVINVSSVASFVPYGGNEIYGATKAFLNVFTESLFEKYRKDGLQFQALCPGFTITEFHKTMWGKELSPMLRLLAMSADEVVCQSLAALPAGPVVFIPGWINRVVVFVSRSFFLSPFLRIFTPLTERDIIRPLRER